METTMSAVEARLAKRDDIHLARKLWHMCWGSLALGFYYFMSWEQHTAAIICFVAAILAFSFDFTRIKFPRINNLVFKFFGPFMRKSEATKITGLPYYALGMAISLYFFSYEASFLSILFLTFSDPLSSLFGILYGRKKILPGKSFEGSFAGFCVCYCLTLVYLGEVGHSQAGLILFSVFAGIIGSVSELASAFKIDDNLTIPVISGAGIMALNSFFQIY